MKRVPQSSDSASDGDLRAPKAPRVSLPLSASSNLKQLVSGRMYYTTVSILPDNFNEDAFALSDILERIKPLVSIHLNFMIDATWLLSQYPASFRHTPITLIVGEKMGTSRSSLLTELRNFKNVSVDCAKLPIPFGTHHAKLSLFECEKGIHVIVSTANLVPGDWEAKTQCFYYAHGMFLTDKNDPSSNDAFTNDLVRYLQFYKSEAVDYWCDRLKHADFSSIEDRLVFSVPGYHTGSQMNQVGHISLRGLISQLASTSEVSVPPLFKSQSETSSRSSTTAKPPSRLLVMQCSSIGSLGPTAHSWLIPQFVKSLDGGVVRGDSRPLLIYPTVEDVRGSIEGYGAGCSLPYQNKTAVKQSWLTGLMCKWRAEGIGRSKAMPHCKTYCELVNGSPRWLLMSSANLSKAAWGEMQKGCTQLMIRSYEMGVLITDASRMKVPYDYPLLKYKSNDIAWMTDKNYTEPDWLGEHWIVSM